MTRAGDSNNGKAVLRGAVLGQRRHLLVATGFLASYQAGEALVPVLIGVVIDRAVASSDGVALLWWLAVLALTFLVLNLSWQYAMRRCVLGASHAERSLRVDLARRVLDARGGAEAKRLPGSLVNIAMADVRMVSEANFLIPNGIAAAVGVGFASVVLLVISVPLGLVILLGTPPLLYLVQLLSKPLEKRTAAQQEQAAQASGTATDLVVGVRVLKGIGAEQAALSRYRVISRRSLAATLRTSRAQAGYQGLVLIINGLFLALVALIGGRLAMAGDISVGELVSAVGLAQFLQAPLVMFGRVNAVLASARAAARRVGEILAAPPAVALGKRRLPDALLGELRLHQVSTGSLAAFNLRVRAGELIGVVTVDPADATALVRCVNREVDPAQGQIDVDGVALTELDPLDVRAVILVSAHDADLFEGTVQDNVAAAQPLGDIRPAVSAAQVDAVAAALPHGSDTLITERGRSLSGGQRQRVALARALATDAPVLVLHDPTTAVDAVTEARIATGIRELRTGKTTLLITTSAALLAVTDRVVLVEGGAITADDVHGELARSHAGYRELVLS